MQERSQVDDNMSEENLLSLLLDMKRKGLADVKEIKGAEGAEVPNVRFLRVY